MPSHTPADNARSHAASGYGCRSRARARCCSASGHAHAAVRRAVLSPHVARSVTGMPALQPPLPLPLLLLPPLHTLPCCCRCCCPVHAARPARPSLRAPTRPAARAQHPHPYGRRPPTTTAAHIAVPTNLARHALTRHAAGTSSSLYSSVAQYSRLMRPELPHPTSSSAVRHPSTPAVPCRRSSQQRWWCPRAHSTAPSPPPQSRWRGRSCCWPPRGLVAAPGQGKVVKLTVNGQSKEREAGRSRGQLLCRCTGVP